jgi:flavin-dependent dehydrogenase
MNSFPSSETRTIAILGGGPAGTATALSLLKSLRSEPNYQSEQWQVRIFNAPRHNDFRVGESIPPAATTILKRLGVADIVQNNIHIKCPGSISKWNGDKVQHNDFILDLEGLGYHLNREKFEQQLLQHVVKAGGIVHQGWRFIETSTDKMNTELLFSNQDKQVKKINADFVVDATGKASVYAKHLNVCRNSFDDVTFICAFIDIPKQAEILNHTFVESIEHGWWYAARLPGNKMIVTLCTDRKSIKEHQWNKPENWLDLLKQTKWIKLNLPKEMLKVGIDSTQVILHSAPSSLLSSICDRNWLAVGDAASSYDPITSAGITKALMQGEMAGNAIANILTKNSPTKLADYQTHVIEDFKRYAVLRNELYRSETLFSDKPFWLRRLGIVA